MFSQNGFSSVIIILVVLGVAAISGSIYFSNNNEDAKNIFRSRPHQVVILHSIQAYHGLCHDIHDTGNFVGHSSFAWTAF
mgnify:CR=1 FL=1